MDLSDVLTVIGTAALPILELRASIPIAIVRYQFDWYYAYLFSVIGNLLPVPFILKYLDTIISVLSKVRFIDRSIQWFLSRTRRRGKIVERYETIGLTLFVAIPLPITGAWTGSILAVIMGLKFKHSMISISLGIFIAGIIVTCATQLGWAVAGLFTKPA